MATHSSANIGPGNGLVPCSNKPSHEPMLIYHQWVLWYSHKKKFTSSTYGAIPQMKLNITHSRYLAVTFPILVSTTCEDHDELWVSFVNKYHKVTILSRQCESNTCIWGGKVNINMISILRNTIKMFRVLVTCRLSALVLSLGLMTQIYVGQLP